MALTSQGHLRLLLGERIPEGKTGFDTMFSDDEIQHFLDQGNGKVEAAAWYGWVAKAAEFANYTNVIEGNSSREMAELHRQALRMIAKYEGYVATPSRGRARIGKIVRPGVNG